MKDKGYNGAPGKIFTQPSLTVPDQTMSIRTIMERYARGLPIDGQKTPQYDVDNLSTGRDPRKMDLVDIQVMTAEIKQTLKNEKNRIAKADAKQKEDDLEKIIQDRINSNNNP